MAARCGAACLALVSTLSAASCAQFHTADDAAPALAVVPSELEQSLRAGVAREVLVELRSASSAPERQSAGSGAAAESAGAAGATASGDTAAAAGATPKRGDGDPAEGSLAAWDSSQGDGARDAAASNTLAPQARGASSAGRAQQADASAPDLAGTEEFPSAAPSSSSPARDELESAERLAVRAARYRAAQARVLAAVSGQDVTLLRRYTALPFVFVRVHTLAGLHALAAHADVVRLHSERRFDALQLAAPPANLALIEQPAVAASGMTGAGTSIAVLDTGCDFRRSAFGSCASPGLGCKVAAASDFALDDGVPDDLGHGTNVAAIALAVAPDTRILALDVFDGPTAPASAILAAIDWVIQNRALYDTVAMNMSFGAGRYEEPCASDVFAVAMGHARSAGILPIVASGNSAYSDALASPACTPAAFSVGAVYTASAGSVLYGVCSDASTSADQIACFSNSASFLSLLAPGTQIAAGGLTLSGTSQAAPHVAGAFAVLRAAWPSESFAQSIARLSQNGPLLTDPRSGVRTRRLDLRAAAAVDAVRELGPPQVELQIDGGAAATRDRRVMLRLSPGGGATPESMCVSNGAGDCEEFEAFSDERSWQLDGDDGDKTVRVVFQDAAGRRSTSSASIRLDTQAPTGSALQARAGAEQVSLSWSAASDDGSGVRSYRLVYAASAAPSCETGSALYTGSALSFTHTGLSDGAIYGYRVCPIDAAGNIGAGSSVAARPAPEFDPPLGTLAIDGGASSTTRTSATLTITATDDSGVAAMCISNRATCSEWEPFASERTWTLSPAGGAAHVYAWFKDGYGNVSPKPATASITLDAPETSSETLQADAAESSVRLSWSPADAAPSVAGFTLVFLLGSQAPESCSQGSVLYAGNARNYDHVGLLSGARYSYRLCAFDRAGNLTRGVAATARVP